LPPFIKEFNEILVDIPNGLSKINILINTNLNKLFLLPLIIILQIFLLKPIQVLADLPTGNAVKDPNAILRNALPIKQVELQEIHH